MLPNFQIRGLRCCSTDSAAPAAEDGWANVQLEDEAQYDQLIGQHPETTLSYVDEDDGEVITVGSSGELFSRIAELHPLTPVVFDLLISASHPSYAPALKYWKEILEKQASKPSSKDKGKGKATQELEEDPGPSSTARSGILVDLSEENAAKKPEEKKTNDLPQPFMSMFESELQKIISGSVESVVSAPPSRAPTPEPELPCLSPLDSQRSCQNPAELLGFTIRNIVQNIGRVASELRTDLPSHAQPTVENLNNALHTAIGAFTSQLQNVALEAATAARNAAQATRDMDTTEIEATGRRMRELAENIGHLAVTGADEARNVARVAREEAAKFGVVGEQAWKVATEVGSVGKEIGRNVRQVVDKGKGKQQEDQVEKEVVEQKGECAEESSSKKASVEEEEPSWKAVPITIPQAASDFSSQPQSASSTSDEESRRSASDEWVPNRFPRSHKDRGYNAEASLDDKHYWRGGRISRHMHMHHRPRHHLARPLHVPPQSPPRSPQQGEHAPPPPPPPPPPPQFDGSPREHRRPSGPPSDQWWDRPQFHRFPPPPPPHHFLRDEARSLRHSHSFSGRSTQQPLFKPHYNPIHLDRHFHPRRGGNDNSSNESTDGGSQRSGTEEKAYESNDRKDDADDFQFTNFGYPESRRSRTVGSTSSRESWTAPPPAPSLGPVDLSRSLSRTSSLAHIHPNSTEHAMLRFPSLSQFRGPSPPSGLSVRASVPNFRSEQQPETSAELGANPFATPPRQPSPPAVALERTPSVEDFDSSSSFQSRSVPGGWPQAIVIPPPPPPAPMGAFVPRGLRRANTTAGIASSSSMSSLRGTLNSNKFDARPNSFSGRPDVSLGIASVGINHMTPEPASEPVPEAEPESTSQPETEVDRCVAQLLEMGYADGDDGDQSGIERLKVYAQIAQGKIEDAMEMLEEERTAWAQRAE